MKTNIFYMNHILMFLCTLNYTNKNTIRNNFDKTFLVGFKKFITVTPHFKKFQGLDLNKIARKIYF